MNLTPTNKPVVLGIDDEKLGLELIRFILKKNGFEFYGTDQPDEFFELLESKNPDLILLDVLLQDTTGFELCKKIKATQKHSDIPIIFLTGKIDVEDKVKGFELGGVDYITKTF